MSTAWRKPALVRALLPITALLLAGCPDPMKKYTLDPRALVANGLDEQSARAAAPFGDELVRYLLGKPRSEGDEFILRVDFEPGGFAPIMDTIGDVEALLVVMRDFPSLEIAIEGHTDNAGDAQKNQKLSQWRANWVKQFLLERGISAERVDAKGMGDSEPIVGNDTEEERKKNRRLVVRVKNYNGKPMPVRESRIKGW
ncbi:OmpA family protein [Microbulbifer sp. SA54]|uniref:OmpA family protein n=1 Tax=Microbulbifer sp. SA54 TaxID=3401577 RepID=UPI003AAB581D